MIHPWIDAIERSDDVSASTKHQYVTNLQTLLRSLGAQGTLEYVVTRPKEMLQRIATMYDNDQTRKAMIAAVKAVFKNVPELASRCIREQDAWHSAFKSLDRSILTKMASAEPTPRELENWVPWDAILAKRRELEYGSMDHLVLSMYSLIEPIRADFGNVRLSTVPVSKNIRSGNFIVLPPSFPELVLNTYKTSEKYGQFRRNLPDELVRTIFASIDSQPREYLFVDERGRPYVKNNSFARLVNRTLAKLFGKKVTIRMLRHAFISSLDFNEKSPGELMKHSKNMMHSIAQQQLYRRKIPASKISPPVKPAAEPVAPPARQEYAPPIPANDGGMWLTFRL